MEHIHLNLFFCLVMSKCECRAIGEVGEVSEQQRKSLADSFYIYGDWQIFARKCEFLRFYHYLAPKFMVVKLARRAYTYDVR